MKVLYEVLVPTIYGDTLKPIRTKHHKQWDKFVQSITGGLTIGSPARGKWIDKGIEYPERIIPVRIMCEEKFHLVPDTESLEQYQDKMQIDKIVQFTLTHYRQKAVFYYVVSNNVQVVYNK